MKINLLNLQNKLGEPYFFEGNISNHNLNEKLKQHHIGPINYEGHIYKLTDGLYADVDISYIYKTNCDRCLEGVKRSQTINVYGRLIPYEKLVKHYETDKRQERIIKIEDEEDYIYYKDDYLDIMELIDNYVISSLPMKTLCSENCKGLCKRCGIDLNKANCDCDTTFIDPRLEKLKDIVIDE